MHKSSELELIELNFGNTHTESDININERLSALDFQTNKVLRN